MLRIAGSPILLRLPGACRSPTCGVELSAVGEAQADPYLAEEHFQERLRRSLHKGRRKRRKALRAEQDAGISYTTCYDAAME